MPDEPTRPQILDELVITVVVENRTDTLSSIEPGIPQAPELAGHIARASRGAPDSDQIRIEAFGQLCLACHGFSALLEGRVGDQAHSVLVDAGPDGEVWLENARRLDLDIATIDAVFLSHWHHDHSGALPAVIGAIAEARHAAGREPPVVDVHPSRPDQRAAQPVPGTLVTLPPEPTLGALSDAGARLERHDEPHLLAGGLFLASGEIERRTEFETGLPGHHSIRDGVATPDPLIIDERLVAAEVRGRGVTVISPCSHAGIVNACLTAKHHFPDTPIDLVLGGFHLGGKAVEERISATADQLDELISPRLVAPGHCTGWRAEAALAERFGSQRFAPSVVGTTYTLAAP